MYTALPITFTGWANKCPCNKSNHYFPGYKSTQVMTSFNDQIKHITYRCCAEEGRLVVRLGAGGDLRSWVGSWVLGIGLFVHSRLLPILILDRLMLS